MKKLAYLTPSRGRPVQLERLIKSWLVTTEGLTDLIVGYDADDNSYFELMKQYPQVIWYKNEVKINNAFAKLLNLMADVYKDKYRYLGFMEDDCEFQTANFEHKIFDKIDKMQYCVAYTNDKLNTPQLVSLPILSSNLVRGLGFYCPPKLNCIFIDYFWRDLAKELDCGVYFEDIIIAHLHYKVTGVAKDKISEAVDTLGADKDVGEYNAYKGEPFKQDIAFLKRLFTIQWSEPISTINQFDTLRQHVLSGNLSTDRHLLTLYSLVLSLNAKNILELGVKEGNSTLPLLMGAKETNGKLISVDIQPTIFVPSQDLSQYWQFIQSDSVDFLTKQREKFDLIFIDDWHAYEHVVKELEQIDRLVSPKSVVLVHDTMYCGTEPYYHTDLTPNAGPQWAYGGPYRAIAELNHQFWEFSTIPVGHGLTILRKKYSSRY